MNDYLSFRWMPFLLLTGCIFLTFSSGCSSAADGAIYVSPDGNDQHPGTRDQPVASLPRAAELARTSMASESGKTVWLAGGVYRLEAPLELGPDDSGRSGTPVVWKALPGEKAVISGGVLLTGWREEGDGRWSAPLPASLTGGFRSLYVNGRRAVRARFPNDGYLRVLRAGEDDRTNFFFDEGEIPELGSVTGMELILLHDWSISRVGVRSIDWEQQQLFSADTIGALSPSFFTLTNWEEHPRYFLENAAEFLDQPGEWYLDKEQRRIYYLPVAGEVLEEAEAIVPLATRLLTIKGDRDSEQVTGFLQFEGIIFEHTSWPLPPGGYAGIQACMFDQRINKGAGWNKVPAAIEVDRAEQIRFSDCVLRHTGGSGIWIRESSRDCTVERCRVYDISGNGINVGEGRDRRVNGRPWWREAPEQVSRNTRITHNLVEDCGRQFFGAVGIWGGLVAGTIIDHNEVRQLPYTGVSIGWMWDTIPTPCRENMITDNHIHHIMNTLSDGGGIYMLGLQPGSRITGNLIHDVSVNVGRAESNGMFLDEGIKEVLVEDNIIYDIARSPLRFHRASTNTVRGNVLMCGPDIPPIQYNRTPEEAIRKVDNILLEESREVDRARLGKLVEARLPAVGPE